MSNPLTPSTPLTPGSPYFGGCNEVIYDNEPCSCQSFVQEESKTEEGKMDFYCSNPRCGHHKDQHQ